MTNPREPHDAGWDDEHADHVDEVAVASIDGLDGEDDDVTTLLFTATNPPGTVSATAVTDGRTVRIDLSSHITEMTESHLAQEITLIARLARRQAQAAQHAMAANMMQRLGHDGPSTQSYLERELGLPSPQTVLSEKAQLFATRYADDDE